MRRSVSIKDVAAAAGVSTTTVSHALNDKGRLRDVTRRHVREVADDLGYQPSALARGLAGGRTGLLAMTVSASDDFALQVGDLDYFLQVMNASTSAALEHGYALTLLPTHWSPEILAGLPLDGGIVIDPVREDRVVGALRARGLPMVTLGRQPGGPDDAPWVDNDHHTGTRAMLDHLVDAGATRVALLAAHMVSSYALDTHEAYQQWCREVGMDPLVGTVQGSLSERGAFAAALKLLEHPSQPDAIYATLDRLAVAALLAAETLGLAVPSRVRIAACTESEDNRRIRPALSTLSLNPELLASEAIGLLTDLIEGRPTRLQRVVPSVLIARRSTLNAGRRGSRTIIAAPTDRGGSPNGRAAPRAR